MNVIRITLAVCLIYASYQLLSPSSGIASWKRIDVEVEANLQEHLIDLSKQEQIEQVRDWIVFSFFQFANIGKEKFYKIFYDYSPLRQEFKKELIDYQYGPSRSINLANGDVYVFVPEGDKKRKVYIARKCDAYRTLYNRKPKRVIVVDYRVEIDSNVVGSFVLKETLAANKVYSSAFGYYEQTVNFKEDLQAFLSKVDDVTYVVESNKGIILMGGRKFEAFPTKGVKLEDVAVLYQAYSQQKGRRLNRPRTLSYVPDLVSHYKKDYEYKSSPYLYGWVDNNGVVKKIENEFYEKEPAIASILEKSQNLNFPNTPTLNPSLLNPLLYFNQGKIIILGFSLDWAIEIKRFSVSLKELADKIMKLDEKRTGKEMNYTYYLTANIRELSPTANYQALFYVAGEAGKENLAPYYQFKNYLDGTLPFEISPKTSERIFSDSLIVKEYILHDLLYLLEEAGFKVSPDKSKYDQELSKAIQKFQLDVSLIPTGILDQKTFSLLLNRSKIKKKEFRNLSWHLDKLHQDNSYQKGRYDGSLQGTKVGMTLFYTDLIMKLLAIDYRGTAPEKDIFGFKSIVNRKIGFTFYEELKKLPNTRFWLEKLSTGYDTKSNHLYFDHCITRISNRSSSNLNTKKEYQANFESFLFADWWSKNFSRVADYDQEYHRLNQIMKWSLIVHWMQEKECFSFLEEESVTRDFNFENWYSAQDLRVDIPIPFKDREKLGEKTECIKLISSRSFSSYKNINFYKSLIGGVQLLNIQTQPHNPFHKKKKEEKRAKRNKNDMLRKWSKEEQYKYSILSGQTNYNYLDGRSVKANPKTKTTTISTIIKAHQTVIGKNQPTPPPVLRATNAELNTKEISYSIKPSKKKTTLKESISWATIGDVELANATFKVTMTYQPGELIQAENLLYQMHEIETDNGHELMAFDHEKVENYVEDCENGDYVVKLKDSEKWLQIKTGPSGNNIPFDIKVAKNINDQTNDVDYYHGKFITETAASLLVLKARLSSLVDKSNGIIKEVIYNPNAPIKLLPTNILQMPQNPTPSEVKTAEFVIEKINQNLSIVDALKEIDRIAPEDIAILSAINSKHLHLWKSYFEFKNLQILEDYAVVDLNMLAAGPQVLIASKRDGIQVLDVPVGIRMDVREAGKKLEDFRNGDIPPTYEVFLALTLPYAMGLRHIMEQTSATNIVVKPVKGINPNVVQKMHGLNSDKKIWKDQPDIDLSITHAQANIYPDINSMVFASTYNYEKFEDDSINVLIGQIYNTGLTVHTSLSSQGFMDILTNDSLEQIILTIKTMEKGLLFSDRLVTFTELQYLMNTTFPVKDLLYVITNEGEKVQSFFASTGKFNYVVSSEYQIGDLESLQRPLFYLEDFLQEFTNEKFRITSSDYKKLVRKFPVLGKALSRHVRKVGRYYEIAHGRLRKGTKSLFTYKVIRFINKYLPKGQPFQMKSIENAIDKVQQKRIDQMRKSAPVRPFDPKDYRAIPDLKVDVGNVGLKIRELV